MTPWIINETGNSRLAICFCTSAVIIRMSILADHSRGQQIAPVSCWSATGQLLVKSWTLLCLMTRSDHTGHKSRWPFYCGQPLTTSIQASLPGLRPTLCKLHALLALKNDGQNVCSFILYGQLGVWNLIPFWWSFNKALCFITECFCCSMARLFWWWPLFYSLMCSAINIYGSGTLLPVKNVFLALGRRLNTFINQP